MVVRSEPKQCPLDVMQIIKSISIYWKELKVLSFKKMTGSEEENRNTIEL